MTRLVLAEFRKLLTTWLWLWMLLGCVGLVMLFASIALGFDGSPQNPSPRVNTPDGLRNVFTAVTGASSLVAVLGVIGMTSEYRHQTVTPTILATPRRERVVLAKLVAYLVVGLVYGFACVLAVLVVALPWLAAKDISIGTTGGGIPNTLAAGVLVLAIYGMFGVGVGALVRNQVAAVVGLLVLLFVIEPIVTSIPTLNSFSKLLPGAAASAIARASQPGVEFLQPWQGTMLLTCYALVAAGLGILTTVRRDIT